MQSKKKKQFRVVWCVETEMDGNTAFVFIIICRFPMVPLPLGRQEHSNECNPLRVRILLDIERRETFVLFRYDKPSFVL